MGGIITNLTCVYVTDSEPVVSRSHHVSSLGTNNIRKKSTRDDLHVTTYQADSYVL